MAEEFASVVISLRANPAQLQADLLAAEKAVDASAKRIQSKLEQTRNPFTGRFSKPVDNPNMGRLLAADAAHAASAMEVVNGKSVSAKQSIQALQGSLFLVTGQTGFFAIEALRAASHIGKLTAAAAASTVAVGGLSAAVGILKTQVIALYTFMLANPVFLALAAAAAAYATAIHFISKEEDEALERQKQLTEAYEKEKGSLDALMRSRWAAAVSTGRMTDTDKREQELLLGDPSMKPSTAAGIVDNENIVKKAEEGAKQALKEAEAGWERLADSNKLMREQMEKDDERAGKSILLGIKLRAAEEKKIQEEKVQFIADLNSRRFADAVRRQKEDTGEVGADFGISSRQFLGNAPVGIFGEQKESKQIVKNTAKTNELLEQWLRMFPVPITGVSMGA